MPTMAQDAPKPKEREAVKERHERLMREARERMAEAEIRMPIPDVKPWRIGLMMDPIDDSLRSHLEIPQKAGVIVTECADDSPAAKAGIRENDIIVLANGRPVGSIEPLRDAVAESAKSGEPLRLSTLRKGQRREVTIKPDIPQPQAERPMIRVIPLSPQAYPGAMREQETMMRRMAEQNNKMMERLERQEIEIKRMREKVEQLSKAMGEMKEEGKKDN